MQFGHFKFIKYLFLILRILSTVTVVVEDFIDTLLQYRYFGFEKGWKFECSTIF